MSLQENRNIMMNDGVWNIIVHGPTWHIWMGISKWWLRYVQLQSCICLVQIPSCECKCPHPRVFVRLSLKPQFGPFLALIGPFLGQQVFFSTWTALVGSKSGIPWPDLWSKVSQLICHPEIHLKRISSYVPRKSLGKTQNLRLWKIMYLEAERVKIHRFLARILIYTTGNNEKMF